MVRGPCLRSISLFLAPEKGGEGRAVSIYVYVRSTLRSRAGNRRALCQAGKREEQRVGGACVRSTSRVAGLGRGLFDAGEFRDAKIITTFVGGRRMA